MSIEMRIRRNKRKQMLKRRRRFIGMVLCMVVILTTAMAMIGIPSTSANDGTYQRVTVMSGDSLWSIVSKVCSDDVNIRKVVDEVKEINNLNSSCITVGDSLLIPIY